MSPIGRPVTSTDTTFDLTLSSLRDFAAAPDVRLYPSLANEHFTVDFELPRTSYTVVDALGRVAFRQNLSPQQKRATVDVTALAAGRYYLLLSSEERTSAHAFQVAR